MRHRTVTLSGEITHDSTGEIARQLLTLQAESLTPINLLIDSGGGHDNAALQLCDLITHLITVPVRGLVLGSCMSAATFVILHCDVRLATPYSRFKIHSGTMSGITLPLDGNTTTNLEHLLSESKTVAERVANLYMRKLGISREQVDALVARGDQRFDDDMSALEAKEIGLITGIIEGKLNIFPEPAQA